MIKLQLNHLRWCVAIGIIAMYVCIYLLYNLSMQNIYVMKSNYAVCVT